MTPHMRKLRTALAVRGHTQALFDGTITPRTFAFDFEDVPVIIRAFRRMVRALDFDICELAMTTYLCAREHGKPFTAIPVFPMRAFHHGAIVYNTTLGIRTPKDLEGNKVGVNRGYTVTTGLWARSILQHEYGVDLSKITWVLSGDEHVAEYKPPPNVITIEPGRTLPELIAAAEIAAAIGIEVDVPNVERLIPNPVEAGFIALRERGLYPINHTIVVRNELLDSDPELASDLFDTLSRAKALYLRRLQQGTIESPSATDTLFKQVMEVTGDPLPYGMAPNRRTLEAIVQYALEQKILSRSVEIEDLFAGVERTEGTE